MIMMGPKKDKGGMISIIIEKMKNGESSYEEGKEHNEEFRQKPEHEEYEVYEHYREEVDGIFRALEEKDKELLAESLKMFIKKCVKE
jgi:hypothetical protein